MTHLQSIASLLLILSTFLGALSPASPQALSINATSQAGHPRSSEVNDATSADEKTKGGLRFRLSEGIEQPDRQSSVKVAPASRLPESMAQKVLKRLPPVKTEEGDKEDFALPDRSLPPPRTGKIINASFPPPEQPESPDRSAVGPLEITRYAPEGDVPLAPQLSVTFSQPMVAVTSQADLNAREVPIKLTPQPPGRWRWVGTKTLLFEPDGRFPMATQYSVTVRAGAMSANGSALASAKTWDFATPPPQVKTTYPAGEAQARDALIFVEFDQRIDPASVLRTVKVRAGKALMKVRLATAEEVEANEAVRKLARAAEQGRWLAFRAVHTTSGETGMALPPNASVNVSIGPGTPSAEGPRNTTKAQGFSFRTFGAFRVVKRECGYDSECSPFDPWFIAFSNPLDAEAFQKSLIRVEPEIPEMKTEVNGNILFIEGIKRGRTTYRLILDRSIKDQFGQTLGTNTTLAFNVGPAPPVLASSGDEFVVLDPSAPQRFSVYSVNLPRLKASLYSVRPEHWEQFADYMRSISQGDEAKRRVPPGHPVASKIIEVKARPDEMAETRIDLSPALTDGFGQVIIVVEPATRIKREERQLVQAWVQVTSIGLDAFVDNTDLIGWATSLKDGQPLKDVQMMVQPMGSTGTSGDDGLARLPLKPQASAKTSILVARRGRDVAILPEQTYWGSEASSWFRKETGDFLRWYVFDDRKMYRPGEEVHIKGWMRRVGSGKGGDVSPLNGAAEAVTYTLKDSRGNEIAKGSIRINALGGFDTSFKLPGTMNLGYAELKLQAEGGDRSVPHREHVHNFQVQEFRRPEFEVSAQASEGPHIVGGHASVSVAANYYAGGGFPNTEVKWSVTSTPAQFTPPNRGDFVFGKWIPWWIEGSDDEESHTETFAGRTDAAGKHQLRIDFDSVNPPRPSSVTAEASVTDVNRQAWTASASLLVHPADLYVGLRSERTFVQQGEPLVVQAIVTDLDGKAVAGRDIRMRAVLLDWIYEKGEWQQQETNPQECSIRSGNEPVKCDFKPNAGGTYRVIATISDDNGRRNESELTLWVAGGKTPPKRDIEQEEVELIPDRKEYQAGDTAELLVQSPFYPAEGVLTLRRSGIIKSERFRMEGPSHTLRVPVEEGCTPNLHVQVDLVGAATRTDPEGKLDERLPKRPAFAQGELNLPIPPLARKLSVKATPRDQALEPGGETVVNVEVRDAAGQPVQGSELAVAVVDESILALTKYRLDDPLAIFYAQRDADASDYHSRENVVLGNLDNAATRTELISHIGGGGEGGGGGGDTTRIFNGRIPVAPMPSPKPLMAIKSVDASLESGRDVIRVRENFNALATFAPSVATDASGRAQVSVKLPDNLTRYRVMAVSVAGGKQFGSGESAITARIPLMVRPSAPRFLNFGDKFELPVVVQNQTERPMDVDVAVRAVNADLTDGAGRRVTVPANDRVEVRFPTAAARAGVARFQIGAVSGQWADAAEVELPVWTPATTEAFATYGEIDAGAIMQPVKAPSNVIKQFGGLEIMTSSTQLQELTDAMLYLLAYPYECSEQLSSRVLAIAALRDVLTAFKAKEMPPPQEMEVAVARDIKRLQGLQNDDGGFGFWRRGEESWPYVSIHVAHALQRAREKNFPVPADMLEKSKRYLRDIERHIPSNYGPEARHALVAYALYVRNRMGDRDAGRARRLIKEAGLENLSLESVGWLLPVLSGDPNSRSEIEAIRRHLNNRATETAATAHFASSYKDSDYLLLNSDRRADGVILEALIGDQPQSDLIPKIVRGLLAHRTRGRWTSTQENVFILLALDRYFVTYEKATPDFVARAWLGERFAGGQEFKGRTTEHHQINVPMRFLAESNKAQNLTLSKNGAGRLYYRVGMQYAPASLKLESADDGFTVERVYEAVDDPMDVRRDGDGAWHIKAGARVRVRLTMAAPARRYHVALVDPLPAGFEALNPALAITGRLPRDQQDEPPTSARHWIRPWFNHQNLRDERAEAFTTLLWEGVYTYSYVARATTPGTFIVPPPKAEEMYHPETFGRGATDRVMIE